MEHKTFFGKIFGAIADIFTSAAKELWNSLTDDEQAALKNGSEIIGIINKHIDEVPEAIIIFVKADFPNIDIDKLYNSLKDAASQLNLKLPTEDLPGAIAAFQEWLKSKEDTVWEQAASIAAQTLGFFLADKKARPGIIASIIEYIFRNWVKIVP